MKQDEKLQEAIERAVNESLPKTAGKLLQDRLNRADEMEVEISNYKESELALKRKIQRLEGEVEELKGREKEVKDKESKADALLAENNERSAKLDKKEDRLELEMVKKELALVKESRTEIKDLTDRVFRNHTVRESVIKNTIESGHNYFDSAAGVEKFNPTGGGSETTTTTTESEDQE